MSLHVERDGGGFLKFANDADIVTSRDNSDKRRLHSYRFESLLRNKFYSIFGF